MKQGSKQANRVADRVPMSGVIVEMARRGQLLANRFWYVRITGLKKCQINFFFIFKNMALLS